MKNTIAIIGADGKMGSAMTYSLARAGYRTLVTRHDQKDLIPLVVKLPLLVGKIRLQIPQSDVRIVFSPREASWEADVIIPTVPYSAQKAVASEIKDVVTGKIVVSVVNPLNDSYDSLLTPPTTSAAEELAGLLPYSNVVKAFNTILAMDFEAPHISERTPDVFVAGDNVDAVCTVMQLVKDTGFAPLYAGKLSMSRTLESMMLLLASLSIRNDYNSLARWKVLHQTANVGQLTQAYSTYGNPGRK